MRSRLQTLAGFLIALTIWLVTRHTLALVAVGIAGTCTALAWLAPALFAPVQRAIDAIIHALVTAVSWILLALVYFGVFTPIRLWRSLTGVDPLRRRRDPAAASYLAPAPAPSRFDRQF